MISGKMIRVATSSTSDRYRGSRSSLPRSQVMSPTAGLLFANTVSWPMSGWPASRRPAGAAPNRLLRNTIDATPVAATSSTETSPMVSQARMSTSSTLTVLAPWPR